MLHCNMLQRSMLQCNTTCYNVTCYSVACYSVTRTQMLRKHVQKINYSFQKSCLNKVHKVIESLGQTDNFIPRNGLFPNPYVYIWKQKKLDDWTTRTLRTFQSVFCFVTVMGYMLFSGIKKHWFIKKNWQSRISILLFFFPFQVFFHVTKRWHRGV